MAKQNRNILKSYFETGDKPTQGQYSDLIDSHVLLSGENTGSLNLLGDINVDGHLTSSGNISGSSTTTITIGGDATIGGDLNVTGNGIFSQVNTGQGLTEVYLMNQNIRTSDNVEFVNITATGNTTLGNTTTDTHTFTGNITASSNISSSQIIEADQFIGNGSLLTGITSSLINITGVTASFTTGSLIVSGNLFHSSASADIRFGIETTGSIIPKNGEFDLGSPTQYWKSSFVSSSHANNFIGTLRGNADTATSATSATSANTATTAVVAQGLTGTPNIAITNITASGNISSSKEFIGSSANITNITSSGNISASGTIFGNDAQFGSSTVTINGPEGHITASGNISASGTVFANQIEVDQLVSRIADDNTGIQIDSDQVIIQGNDVILAKFNTNEIELNKPISSNITASSNISASGEIISDKITVRAITASGGISASGNISIDGVFISNGVGVATHITDTNVLGNVIHPTIIHGTNTSIGTSTSVSPLTASGDISASGTISTLNLQGGGGDITGFTSMSILYITSSVVDVDANTIRIGGTPFSKSDVDNLRAGKMPEQTAREGFTNRLQVDAIFGKEVADYMRFTIGNRIATFLDNNLVHDLNFTGSNNYIAFGKDVNTELRLTGVVTASGNISASGTIFGNDAQFGSSTVTINGPAGHITASGNISSSGIITGEALGISDDATIADLLTVGRIRSTGLSQFGDSNDDTHTFTGNITASGNISASGLSHVLGGDLTIGDDFTFGIHSINSHPSGQFLLLSGSTSILSAQGTNITASGDISSSGTLSANLARVSSTVIDSDISTGDITGSNRLLIQKSSGEGSPEAGTSDVAIFQNNDGGLDASIAIIAADNKRSQLHFGRHDDIDVGGIKYFHDNHDLYPETMQFRVSQSQMMTLKGANLGIGPDHNDPSTFITIQGNLSGGGLTISSSNGAKIIHKGTNVTKTIDRSATDKSSFIEFDTAGVTKWTFGNIAESDDNLYIYNGDSTSDKHISLISNSTTFHTNITASGNISASGDVIADRYFLQGTRILSNSGTEIQINETTLPININGPSINLAAPVTASGIISASGTIIASNFSGTTSGTNTGDQNISNLAITGSDVIFANITSSGNISASGTIVGSNLSGTNTGDQNISNLAITSSDVLFLNITASNVSASGTIVGSNLSGTNTGDQNISNLAITGSDVLFTNITASGNISAVNISSSTQITSLTGKFDKLEVASGADITGSLHLTGSASDLRVDGTIGVGTEAPTTTNVMMHIKSNITSSERPTVIIEAGSGTDNASIQLKNADVNWELQNQGAGYSDSFLIRDTSTTNYPFAIDPSAAGNATHPLLYLENNKVSILGHINANPDANLLVSGNLFISGPNGHITASGNVSASGTIIASNFSGTTSGTNTGDQSLVHLATTGSDVIFANITSSGNVSASGTIVASNFSGTTSGTNTGDQSLVHLAVTSSDVIFANITSSGNISASGDLTITNITANNIAGTITTAAQTNITSVGTLTGLNVSSHITSSGNISASNTIFSNHARFGGSTTIDNNNIVYIDGDSGHITASGNISASGDLTNTGNIITTNITASGGISASGMGSFSNTKVIASYDFVDGTSNIEGFSYNSNKIRSNQSFSIAGTLTTTDAITTTHITASGDITSSGTIQSIGNITTNGTLLTDTLHVTSSVNNASTASLVVAADLSEVRFENLPTNRPTVTGSLWLSGSAGQGSKFLVVFTGE